MMLITGLSVPLPAGFVDAAAVNGIAIEISPAGVFAADPAAAEALRAQFAGSAAELGWWKARRQAELDTLFNSNFDLSAFIRAGTATNITATNVGSFLATIVNNYRSKRAAIANAATVAGVQAVSITAGWPSNP